MSSHKHLSNLAKKIEYNPVNIVKEAKRSIALDPAFGSSDFAIVATQLVNGKIQVIHAEEHKRPDFSAMIQQVWELVHAYGHVTNIYCDAANPVVWQALKKEFNESYNEQYIKDTIATCKNFNLPIENRMFIAPIPFQTKDKKMLQHAKWLLDEKDTDGTSLVAIDKRFDKLQTSLRTAVANEYKLDKTQTSFNDILDAFLLACSFFKRVK